MDQHQHLLVPLTSKAEEHGRITIAQEGDHIPFPVGRMFMIDRVPEGGSRGVHAHRHQHELVIMVRGSCSAVIDDGRHRSELVLNRSDLGLYVPPMHWLELSAFSSDSVCCVLASGSYDTSGYIRDLAEFRLAVIGAE